MKGWLKEKETVVAAAKKMLERGLVSGTAGNVSMRLRPQGGRPLLAITPSSREYDSLTPDDIQVMDFDSNKIEGELTPSVETPMHIAIYKARKDINAIVHTHSVHATAAATAGLSIPAILDEQAVYLGGEIRTAAYAPSGTGELGDNAAAALGDRNAVLLANHGAAGAGKTMAEAFRNAELTEKAAQVFLLASLTGKVNVLSEEVVARLRAGHKT